MKKYYLPAKDIERLIWLQNFVNKIGGYAAKYGIAAGIVTSTQADYAWFAYWMNYRSQHKEYFKKLSKFKNEIINGTGTASVAPTPPSLGAAPAAVAPGVFTRVVSLVTTIKANLAYTEGDGQDLGIEGADATVAMVEMQQTQCAISVRLIAGGHPEIVWTKGDFEGIDIYVDRGNGSWVFLATDTHPNYTDTASLPAAGVAAIWKYRAIYKLDDEHIGDFSNPVSVTVAGI